MNVSQRRIVMLGIALLVVFSGCAEVNDSIAPTESPASSVNGSFTETASTPEFNLSAASGTRVTVVEVIDGDTINIQYENGTVETVRLLGVDTPETAVTQTTPDEWQSVPTSADGRDWLASWGTQASAYTTDRLANEEIIIIFDPVSDRRGAKFDLADSFGQVEFEISTNTSGATEAHLYDADAGSYLVEGKDISSLSAGDIFGISANYQTNTNYYITLDDGGQTYTAGRRNTGLSFPYTSSDVDMTAGVFSDTSETTQNAYNIVAVGGLS